MLSGSWPTLTNPHRSLFASPQPHNQWGHKRPKCHCGAWTELAGVLTFSLLPFLTVQAFADSEFGHKVSESLQKKKKLLIQEAIAIDDLRGRAREKSIWYGPDRPKWLGPLPYQYPEYLKGEVAGDYGFDILGLGKDPASFAKYYELELLHARWAMLAAVGVVVPEGLQRFKLAEFTESTWWKVGAAKLEGNSLEYLGVDGLHIAGAQPVVVIAFCQFLLMLGPEYARSCGIDALEPVGWYLPGCKNYPGSFLFDPLSLGDDPVGCEELKVKEIKNGRLAMVAWAGFFAQAFVTRESPIKNMMDFFADPLENNVFAGLEF